MSSKITLLESKLESWIVEINSKIIDMETRLIHMHSDRTKLDTQCFDMSRMISGDFGETEAAGSKKRCRSTVEPIFQGSGSREAINSGSAEQAQSSSQGSSMTPFYSLRPNTSTVLGLYNEWYVDRENVPCVQERDRKYGKSWRQLNPTVGLYKRRKALINFMENELLENEVFEGMTMSTFANIVEVYRWENNLNLNVLCTQTQKEDKRSMIRERLVEIKEKLQNS